MTNIEILKYKKGNIFKKNRKLELDIDTRIVKTLIVGKFRWYKIWKIGKKLNILRLNFYLGEKLSSSSPRAFVQSSSQLAGSWLSSGNHLHKKKFNEKTQKQISRNVHSLRWEKTFSAWKKLLKNWLKRIIKKWIAKMSNISLTACVWPLV